MGNKQSSKENESHDENQKYENPSSTYPSVYSNGYAQPSIQYSVHETATQPYNVPLYPQIPTQAIAPPSYQFTNQIQAIAPPYQFTNPENNQMQASAPPPYQFTNQMQAIAPPPYQFTNQMQAIAPQYNEPIHQFNFPANVNERVPILLSVLLDTTGSMNLYTSESNKTPRNDTICEVVRYLVSELEDKNLHAPNKEKEGVTCITFANGAATNIGNINSNNLKQKWSQIEWSGRTIIMPGWNELKKTYDAEFGDSNVNDRPLLFALVITDGEAEDINEFAAILATDPNSYVVIASMGFGLEHDNALISFNNVAQSNPRVRVIPFKANTHPKTISNTLLKMIE